MCRFPVGYFCITSDMGEMDIIRSNTIPPNLQATVLTLTIGDFVLEKASRFPGYALIYMYRYDEFGVKQQYCFTHFENEPEAELVLIGPNPISRKPNIVWNGFLNLFGGPVYS